MAALPKPLIGLLLATVAFFALWTVALRPKPSSSPAKAPVKAVTVPRATAKPEARSLAKQAPKVSATKPDGSATPVAKPVSQVTTALRAHKVVAVLFYNPAAADDQAMRHELAGIPAHAGRVVKLTVPVSELSKFSAVTGQVPVVTAPTLVLIDAAGQATTVQGYADPLELRQRVADAVAAR